MDAPTGAELVSAGFLRRVGELRFRFQCVSAERESKTAGELVFVRLSALAGGLRGLACTFSLPIYVVW